jgi:urease accessory protein UreE
MTLEKIKSVDKIEVVDSGCVQVRTKTIVTENGVVIGSSLHRHVVAPGDDYAEEDTRVQAICAATHTAAVIAAYKSAIAAQGV